MSSDPAKNRDDDEDYEIVSFEDFCDKSPSAKTDLLTLNDNINYRLCYESDKASKFVNEGESSRYPENLTETSLNGPKNVTFKKRLSGTFAPFGRHNGKARGSLFSGVIPKPRVDGESSSREQLRYQRFSESRNTWQRFRDNLPSLGSSMLGVTLLCALCVGVWWAVCGAVGGAWSEEHYRKLWERAHPDNGKNQVWKQEPVVYEKIGPEYRYHDHNNLSTKNKLNATELTKKRIDNKKAYADMTPEQQKEVCQKVEENMRFDCYPTEGASEELCEKRGCCWKPATTQGAPYCFYPPDYQSYRFVNLSEGWHGLTAHYARARPSPYPGDFNIVRFEFTFLSDDMLRVKIVDAEHDRFEPPIPEIATVTKKLTNMNYRVLLGVSSCGFQVVRNSDNVTVINTEDAGAPIFSEKLLQISAILSANHVFGLGEHRSRFMRDMNWKTYTMFNHDSPPVDNMNLYGTQPFYLAVEPNGKSHGMLLLNSNAIDVVLQPTPAITYRAIGGILNLFIFLGPSPREVVSQYTEVIGRPFMPPYWSLGFHLCKFGYHDLNTTRHVWKTNREAGIPFDVQWNDIDYMENQNDFTLDQKRYGELPKFVDELHDAGMRYVMILDPGISASEKPGTYRPYDYGIELDIFVKNKTGQPFIGKVWNPVSTVFPDFTSVNGTAYWYYMLQEFHQKVKFDGVWIDMNEPSNFLNGQMGGECDPENLPYKPAFIPPEGLKSKTLCMDAKHYIGSHYDVHNLYGLAEAISTNFALSDVIGKRPFIISRSSFPGLGYYAGHWSGDIFSSWDDMRMTIPDILSFSLFGVPMMGADICGFNGNTTVELCRRWMQLGAFYPFSRNHNTNNAIPQDPVSLGPSVVEASIWALRLRYKLLPYYYTLFWHANLYGDTVARPLFFEDPANTRLHDIDDQFMIGPYIMITPILTPGATHSQAVFPGPQRWYSFVTGRFLCSDTWREVSETDLVSVKGGAIIPLQEPPATGPVSTTNSRSMPLQLLVVPDNHGNASGDLYWDDGDGFTSFNERRHTYIKFNLVREDLTSKVEWWGYGVPAINNITILGQQIAVDNVSINGATCEKPNCQFTYVADTKILQIHTQLRLDKPFNIQWTYKPQKLKYIPLRKNRDILKTQHGKKMRDVDINAINCKDKDCSEYD